MFNVRLAGGHMYGKQLFTWLSLVVSVMAFFVLSFFPLDVLDEIWDLIESISEGFLTYFCLACDNQIFLTLPQNLACHHRWFCNTSFHFDLCSAALVVLAKSIPVHSLILSFHLFFCLPLLPFSFIVSCRIVFT